MARWTRSGPVFAGGLLAGMLVVNIVNIIGYWHGGMPGGEIVGLLMIPLLLYAGCIIGQERKQPKTYQRGYRKGYQDGVDVAGNALHHVNCRHQIQPVNHDSTGQ